MSCLQLFKEKIEKRGYYSINTFGIVDVNGWLAEQLGSKNALNVLKIVVQPRDQNVEKVGEDAHRPLDGEASCPEDLQVKEVERSFTDQDSNRVLESGGSNLCLQSPGQFFSRLGSFSEHLPGQLGPVRVQATDGRLVPRVERVELVRKPDVCFRIHFGSG